jgi:glyoxylase-like metal-dependent hydrolase (beta-lactamase superfamily II)
MRYQVTTLFGGFGGRLSNNFYLGLGSIALIQGHGHNILVDTGSAAFREAFVKGFLTPYGLSFEDIDTVLLTHLHFDHAGCVDFYPQATFVLGKEEWTFQNNVECKDPNLAEACLAPLRVFNKKLVSFDGEEILPGIAALMTPGHTPGCVSYVLTQGEDRWVFAGDALKNRGELKSGEVMLTANSAQSAESIKKIAAIATRILPGHDGWITLKDGAIIAEGDNDLVINFTQGVTVNGGKTSVTIHMD